MFYKTYSSFPFLPWKYPRRHARYDESGRPHTYGVRLGPWGSFATETCRPTACNLRATPPPFTLTNNWNYTFSAKERDSETGLSYFGSRYYSSGLSIWLSVDPQAAKYASLSPYVYCADNPIVVVDPNGADTVFVNRNTGKTTIKKCEGQDVISCGLSNVTLSGNGVFAQAKDAEGQSNDSQTILSGLTDNDAAKVFHFMADNTNVEWGYMKTKDNKNYIGANHTKAGKDGESVIYNMVMEASPGSVLLYNHSHWSESYSTTGWTPSTFATANNPQNSDHKAWKEILINQPTISMGIRYAGLTRCWIKRGKPIEDFKYIFYSTD